jgi:hypothetical protein
MELTPAQRLITFAIIVLVLGGLGVYLFLPKSDGASAASRPTPKATTSPRSSGSGGSAPPTVAPSAPPTTASAPGKAPDIYAWLPFTQSALASAAQVTTRFAAEYGTFSYREGVNGYLAPMKSIITEQLGILIGRAYTTPGVVTNRDATKQVYTGSGVITSLRAFGPSSITFVVNLTERIASTKGTSTQTASWAITVTGSGANWQVSNIEPGSDGDQ